MRCKHKHGIVLPGLLVIRATNILGYILQINGSTNQEPWEQPTNTSSNSHFKCWMVDTENALVCGVPNRSMLPNPAHIRGLGPASATDSRSDPSQLKHTVEVKAAAPLSFPSFSFFSFFSFFFFFFSWRETESNFYCTMHRFARNVRMALVWHDGFHCMKYPALIPFHISSPCCFWYFHRTCGF